MGRVKFFINGTKKTLLESIVRKEGDRGVDQAGFMLPPNVNTCTNDCVEYIQDIADLKHLKLYLPFDSELGDESGNKNHATGFSNIPAFTSNWEFECSLTDSGLNNNTLVLCCCGAIDYCTGKVGCNAFKFNGSTSLSAGCCAEACYDTEHYQKFSGALWFRVASTSCDQGLLVKSTDLSTATGWKIYLCSSNNRVNFTYGDGTSAFTVNTSNCSVSTCTWYHIAFTYGGGSNENCMAIYLDGECATNCKACSAISCTIRNNECLTIGAESDGGSKIVCGGMMDCVYIFPNTQLTAGQVTRLYHEGGLSYQCGKWGNSVKFDGVSGFFSIPDSCDFDLCGQFEMIWWMKAAGSCSARTVFNKNSMCDTFDFKINACCKGVFRFGCTTLTSCTDIADCTFHQIRVKRDSCCTVELYVCNTKEACASCVMCDETSCSNLVFGRNECMGEYFDGELDSFRWYKGNLNSTDITNLFTKKNPISIMKFGGKVTKIEKEIRHKDIQAQSHGKVLGETEVNPQRYDCKSPEFIIRDLVINNTSLYVVPYPASSGITIKKFLADGKLFDLVDDLISLMGATFYTDGLGVFHYQPKQFRFKSNIFTHGQNTRIWETKFDDTELVNELTVLGENKRYQETELASGDGTNKAFILNEAAVSIKVEHPIGTELVPEVCYELDTLGKTVTFCCAPAMGCCNIQFDYEYEVPLFIKGRKQSSIDANGLHSKRLVLPWIRERNDGVRFIAGYLNRFSSVRQNLKIEHPTLLTSLRENDVINVVNCIKNINGTFVIKAIKFEYPKFITTLEVGEYSFDDFEYDKQIAQKIHDLEGAVSTIRDLRGFESPEECLGICDTVAINAHLQAQPECVCICDSQTVTEIFDATYDCCCTFYDDDDAYV